MLYQNSDEKPIFWAFSSQELGNMSLFLMGVVDLPPKKENKLRDTRNTITCVFLLKFVQVYH